MPLWEQAVLPICQLSDTLGTLAVDQRDTKCVLHIGAGRSQLTCGLASASVKLMGSTPANYSVHILTRLSL